MIIEIHPDKKLKDINNAFKLVYPFLKLEFFSHSHQWQEGNIELQRLNQQLTVDEATGHQSVSGYIEIHYWQKTGVLEMNFLKQFKLAVQVYRKYGDQWIQTSGTDELSLEEQNEAGMRVDMLKSGFTRASDLEKNI